MATQTVTILIVEGDKSLDITRELTLDWSGSEIPHISKLIQTTADDAILEIRKAEAGKATNGDPTFR